jgi:hypothetical protein
VSRSSCLQMAPARINGLPLNLLVAVVLCGGAVMTAASAMAMQVRRHTPPHCMLLLSMPTSHVLS